MSEFLRSFKEKSRQLDFGSCDQQTEQAIYRARYNQIRTHQNLGGLTQAEV
ncbi:hypothetical protein [Rheinheimera oceanensis]|uniref:hypothetical protein n=1 Tax=Rheinheimera oceanensis TaxID=2817449 RepID=UPI001BFDD6FA|nr:hypothetical protein [Rheinheimera oceanensis]